MSEEQLAAMWKAEIEKSLAEEQGLRERLRPVEFPSDLWQVFRGAYGDVREDVAFLFCPKDLLPEMQKLRRLDFEDKDAEQINFDNLCENLSHQLSFYSATYLVMPYFLLFYEKKRKEQDFQWQMKVLENAGSILSTDFPENTGGTDGISADILESYQLSIELFRERAKEFLRENMETLKQQDPIELLYFCTGLLALFGNAEDAFQMLVGSWEQAPVACLNCGYFDEEMEADGFYEEMEDGGEEPEGSCCGPVVKERVTPAASVLGQWDGEDFENTYLWFSNLAHELGMEGAWKIPYYYGTYTCPECGSKGPLMDLVKKCQF
ncbi:MAG: hypothetical protein HFH43_01050 [Lachnospiraceae bacterium]|nr:hypothetical protein [Lachnospiraceae bacterium]